MNLLRGPRLRPTRILRASSIVRFLNAVDARRVYLNTNVEGEAFSYAVVATVPASPDESAIIASEKTAD